MEQTQFFGNQKHLKVFLKAVNMGDMMVWNHFVHSQGPAFRPDLSGIEMTDCKINEANLSRARLVQSVWKGVDAKRINLENADLSESVMENSDLSFIKAGNSLWQDSRVNNLQMLKADLVAADFSRGNFENIDFSGSTLTQARWTDAIQHNLKMVKTTGRRVIVKTAASSQEKKELPAWQQARLDEEKRKQERLKEEAKAQKEREKELQRKKRREGSFYSQFKPH